MNGIIDSGVGSRSACALLGLCGILCIVTTAGCGDDEQTGTGGSPSSSASNGGAGGAGGVAECDDPDTVLAGEQSASRTLTRACSPYQLDGEVIFTGEGTVLTIEAGVEVVGGPNAALRVEERAQLVAEGTEDSPIVLSGDEDAPAPWKGIVLGALEEPPAITHELHYVALRDGAGVDGRDGEGAAVLVVMGFGVAPLNGALLDHVTISQPADVGLRVFHAGAFLARGSAALVVEEAGGYPVVADVQNLATLPANLEVTSKNPDTQRVLVRGGDDGALFGDVAWQPQTVPLELAASISLGDQDHPSSLTFPGEQVLLLGESVDINVRNAKIEATGTDAGCEASGDCSLVFDWAKEGIYWGAISFSSLPGSTMPNDSTLKNVRFAHGGGSFGVVNVLGPGSPGLPGDCSVGPTIEGCSFADREPAPGTVSCLFAQDHSNPYATENSFSGDGCTADVACD